jgi:hypothetical protein
VFVPGLVQSRNPVFNYKCPACGTRVPTKTTLWLWFEGREWIHPDCWKERAAERSKKEQDTIGVIVDLEHVELEWGGPGPST